MVHDQTEREADVGDDHRAVTGGRGRRIERLETRTLRLATHGGPESDGTLTWDATTMILVTARAGGVTGVGYTYADAAAAAIIRGILEPCVIGCDAFAIPAVITRLTQAVRNQGRSGIVAHAISAVDVALWDLKARLLGVSLANLLGVARRTVPVYASGGFTSTHLDALGREIESYVAGGHRRVKIKVGRDPHADLDRVRIARDAAGRDVELMVDANGAYSRKQALAMAVRFETERVVYFEEPVPSDDLEGLHLLRDRGPAGMDIAAGEYGYDGLYFQRMLDAGAVDILQADATRCLGVTGFSRAEALCAAHGVPLSAHCAPALHVQLGAAATRLVHVEAFQDHVRMESLVFDGTPVVKDGELVFDANRPGLGLELRAMEVRRHAI